MACAAVSLYALHNISGGPTITVTLGTTVFTNLAYREVVRGPVFPGPVTVTVQDVNNAYPPYAVQLTISTNRINLLNLGGRFVDGTLTIDARVLPLEDCCPEPGRLIVHAVHGAYGVGPLDFVAGNLLPPAVIAPAVTYGAATGTPVRLSLPSSDATSLLGAHFAGTLEVYAPLGYQFLAAGAVLVAVASGVVTGSSAGTLVTFPVRDCDTYATPFEVERYLGKFFQIAAIPQSFSRTPSDDCTRQVAQYGALSDGTLSVLNSCYRVSVDPAQPGTPVWTLTRRIQGSARVPDSTQGAALLVTFPDVPAPEHANYLIHAVGYPCVPVADYTYAVVGSPNRRALFILAREPTMVPALYQKILKFACKLGYDITTVKVDAGALAHAGSC